MNLIHFYGSSDLQYICLRLEGRMISIRLFALKHRLKICVIKRTAAINFLTETDHS